jgi:hypothetical protein
MAGLCTLANVKLAIFPTSYTDTTDDVTLQLYIDAVTGEVQEYTGRQFVSDTGATDYYFDVAALSRTLYIAQGVQSVTAVSYAKTSQPASGGTYTAITAANILLRPLAQVRRSGFPADTLVITDTDAISWFYPGYNTVKVNGTLGFATVPAEIERLAVAIVVRRWQARRGGQSNDIGASDFGGPILRFMSGEERSLLERYVDVSVG